MPLSGATTLATLQGFRVSEVADEPRLAWEAAAAEQGVPLALSDLEIWHSMGLGPGSTFCTIHDTQTKLAGGFAVQRYASTALPGHRILRLERLGEAIPQGAEPATVAAVLNLARRMPVESWMPIWSSAIFAAVILSAALAIFYRRDF